MTERSLIIIGAGIGGLSAGCYARMNGYRTRIYEQHTTPGGVCTSWRRRGYTVDGCIHHLAGCAPNSQAHKMWCELGALPYPIHYPDDLICIEHQDGRRFTVFTDISALEREMLRLAPADAAVIRQFCRAAHRFARFPMLDMVLATPWDMVKALPYVPAIMTWGKVTLEQFAERLTDPFLRRAIPMIQYDFANIPTVLSLAFIGGCHSGYLGWPVGGALPFSQRIAQRFRDLGGELALGTRVDDILVESGPDGDRAVGVRLADGTEDRADVVISNADGRVTLYDMLGGRYVTERIATYYGSGVPDRQEMSLHVSLGLARDMTDEPHALVLWLPEPIDVAGESRDRLDLELYAFAPEMASEGHTVLKAHFATRYDHWRALRDQGLDAYNAAKQQVAETVIACLDRRFPGLREQVEMIDVSTPVTTERYVGSHRGFQAWGVPDQSPIEALSGQGLSRTLPGLDGFYMVGQWAGGLGLPNVAAMGRKVIRSLCKRDGRRFVTTLP